MNPEDPEKHSPKQNSGKAVKPNHKLNYGFQTVEKRKIKLNKPATPEYSKPHSNPFDLLANEEENVDDSIIDEDDTLEKNYPSNEEDALEEGLSTDADQSMDELETSTTQHTATLRHQTKPIELLSKKGKSKKHAKFAAISAIKLAHISKVSKKILASPSSHPQVRVSRRHQEVNSQHHTTSSAANIPPSPTPARDTVTSSALATSSIPASAPASAPASVPDSVPASVPTSVPTPITTSPHSTSPHSASPFSKHPTILENLDKMPTPLESFTPRPMKLLSKEQSSPLEDNNNEINSPQSDGSNVTKNASHTQNE